MSKRRLLWALVLTGGLVANLVAPIRPNLGVISLPPAIHRPVGLWRIGSSLLCSWLVMLPLVVLARRVSRRLADAPTPFSLQNVAEAVCEALSIFTRRVIRPMVRGISKMGAAFFQGIVAKDQAKIMSNIDGKDEPSAAAEHGANLMLEAGRSRHRKRRRLLWLLGLLPLLGVNLVTPVRPALGEISLTPATLWRLGPWRISNTLFCAWLVMLLLTWVAWRVGRRLVDAPTTRSLQNAAEAACEALLEFMQNFAGSLTRTIFPVAATFFIYILVANWVSLMPGIGSIGIWRTGEGGRAFVPLLRGATTDLNTTMALAIASVTFGHVIGVHQRGLGDYLSRFVPLRNFAEFFRSLLRRKGRLRISLLAQGALDLFVGLLEIVEEMTKIVSFSFRLFGNIFGGEVLLTVMAFLVPYVVSLPFLALEMLAGFIQALIFTTLSTAFFARAAAVHSSGAEPDEADAPIEQPITA